MKIIIGVLLLTGIVGLTYINLDKELYYLGLNDFSWNELPLGIKPDYRPLFEGGFGLRDEYGLAIAAKGNTYKIGSDEISIENVISYCWNDDKLIAEIRSIEGVRYLIEFSRKAGTDDELDVNVFDGKNDLLSSFEKCYDLKKNEGQDNRLITIRSILRFGLLILVFVLVWKVVIVIRKIVVK